MKDVCPVPPLGTVSACASVSAPLLAKVEVAVPPKYATVAESWVVDALPLRSTREVVALCPAAGCVNGSPMTFAPVMVIGAEPRMVKDEQDAEPAQDAVVVDTP